MGIGWQNILATFVWTLVASLAMSLSLGVLTYVWDKMTPNLDEFEELRKGNIAVAIVLGSVIIAFALVVCVMLWPTAPVAPGAMPPAPIPQ